MSRHWTAKPALKAEVDAVMHPTCRACGDSVDGHGCYHEGDALCRSCLHECRTCLEAIKDSDVRAAIRQQPRRRPGMDLRPRKKTA